MDEDRRPLVTPFAVAVAEGQLADLHARLDRTRWPEGDGGDGWDAGTPAATLRRLLAHWRSGFDWRAQERLLNAWPQYLVAARGGRIHCSVTRSAPRLGTRPALLLLAGWPSTVFEHHRVVEPLAETFDVVRMSLPGFGFSDRPRGRGTGTREMARHLLDAMRGLGCETFLVHATDVGARVASMMALERPDRVLGLHLAAVPGLTEDWGALTRLPDPQRGERAYIALQSTRPQTLGYGLADSPAALAAWIVEKWRAWSDCGGELASRFTADDLLTTVSIYWFTGTITSSLRVYLEHRAELGTLGQRRITVPTGFSLFPHPPPRPRGQAEERYAVVSWREMPRGGHFPALEEPETLVAEITSFWHLLAG